MTQILSKRKKFSNLLRKIHLKTTWISSKVEFLYFKPDIYKKESFTWKPISEISGIQLSAKSLVYGTHFIFENDILKLQKTSSNWIRIKVRVLVPNCDNDVIFPNANHFNSK